MWNGISTPTAHGCTSCHGYTKSQRSPRLSSASLLKHKPREPHECTNLMHSDLGQELSWLGIHVRRDELVSVMYSTELNSTTSLVPPQRTDRHGILDQKPPH